MLVLLALLAVVVVLATRCKGDELWHCNKKSPGGNTKQEQSSGDNNT